MSHSVWSAWIEILLGLSSTDTIRSHSVWSAWIEILGNRHVEAPINVALRLECVDRNIPCVRCPKVVWVALRLECVDRNVRN